MKNRNNRILWLLNHTTLRKGEVSLLINMGFEIYTPKKIPQSGGLFRSGSITYEFDETLSIPKNLLKKMNQFNFYESTWPTSLRREINKHFSSAFITSRPEMINKTCAAFTGDIFVRSFGMLGELSSYSDLIKEFCERHVYERIQSKNHIWFAPSYSNIIDVEKAWMKEISVYLPLGLPTTYYKNENTWQPLNNKILFVCPEINTIGYYNQIYKDFKLNFGDFPYIVAGAQPKPVLDDSKVTGYLDQKQYDNLMTSCKVMYYHSREERHLHYHPIEAMLYGMPVIFMTGGMLEELAGKKIPGCCETVAEAKEKIGRILSNDETFTNLVIQGQKNILQKFSPEFIEDSWKKNFLPVIRNDYPAQRRLENERKRTRGINVGIWMHETNISGFTGEGISRLLALIVKSAQQRDDVNITIASVSWVKQSIIEYMDALGVDSQRIRFLMVSTSPPLLFVLYQWWNNRKKRVSHPKKNFFLSLVRKIKPSASYTIKHLISLRGWAGVFVFLGIGTIGLPFLLIYGIISTLLRVYKRIINSTYAHKASDNIRYYVQNLTESFSRLAHSIYHRMVNAELDLLTEKANQAKDIDGWYFPYPSVKNISKFTKPVVVAVPDIVYLDFPTPFSKELKELLGNHPVIEQTVRNANALITFSTYVKENHIIKQGYNNDEKVYVIRHAPIDMLNLITKRPWASEFDIRYRASLIINEYFEKVEIKKTNQTQSYLRALPFGEFDYILVSSQTRPHKNHFNLLKAYKKILREKYINIKLVLTGQLSPEMQEYIKKENLHLDIISLNYLPPKVHAAFYACAKLAIVPTLFEGGFPFVFTEAISVNTPVIMSDIPVVRETISEDLIDTICFDPYDIEDITEKTLWAIENTKMLIDIEKKLYHDMKLRTWNDVADEYIQVFLTTFGENRTTSYLESNLLKKSERSLQNQEEANEQLCIIHVPKTAGTSFFTIIESLLGEKEVTEVGWQSIFSNEKYNLDEYKAISGHFPYEIKKILSKEVTFLTFLRNPIERALSQYIQSQNFPEHWAYNRVRNLNIEQYLNDPNLVTEIMNIQTWLLGLKIDEPISSIRDLMNPRETHQEVTEEMSKNHHNPIWKLGLYTGTLGTPSKEDDNIIVLSANRIASLKLAKERLGQFKFFGITERFRDSMNLFAYTFRLPPIREIPTRRVADKRLKLSEIPVHALDKIRDLNKLDIELYEFAKENFEERYKKMLDDLRETHGKGFKEMTIESLLEKKYWNYIKEETGLLKTLKYDFFQLYPRSGWYSPSGKRPKLYVWSGPGTIASIELPIDRTIDLKIRFQVIDVISKNVLNSLAIRVDDKPVQISHSTIDNLHYFSGTISADLRKAHFASRLSFHVNRTAYPPGMTAETPGARLLGFALSWIEITPLE